MTRIKLDSELLKTISYFESSTGAKVKDCISDDKLIFVIEENDMGKAIGKRGENIRKMENAFKKKIKLVEYSADLLQFVRNLVHPIEITDVRKENDAVIITGKDMSSRAMLIGRERQNIKHMTDIAKRYFDFSEIKVV